MILKVENLCFEYPARSVLSGVSFEIKPGECVALMGVNGAGKSTLIRCINKILMPKKGVVFLDGKDISPLSCRELGRYIGYIPQMINISDLTVFEMVSLGRRPHRSFFLKKEDYYIVENILNSLGLRQLALNCLTDLSGGELQKVMIARALAQEPRIFLMDEPTSHLDLKNQIEVMKLVRRITKKSSRPITSVICLHDINLGLRFADRFLFLKNGKIHAATSREDIDATIIYEIYGVKVELFWFRGSPFIVPIEEGEDGEEGFNKTVFFCDYRPICGDSP